MTALKSEAPGWREQAIIPVLTMRNTANAARTAAVLAEAGLSKTRIEDLKAFGIIA